MTVSERVSVSERERERERERETERERQRERQRETETEEEREEVRMCVRGRARRGAYVCQALSARLRVGTVDERNLPSADTMAETIGPERTVQYKSGRIKATVRGAYCIHNTHAYIATTFTRQRCARNTHVHVHTCSDAAIHTYIHIHNIHVHTYFTSTHTNTKHTNTANTNASHLQTDGSISTAAFRCSHQLKRSESV